jgi:hypothetical protein
MKSLIPVAVVLVTFGAQTAPAPSAAIDRLIASMGGPDLWAKAVSLRVVEEAHSARVRGPVRTIFYRDLERPRIRYESMSRDGTSVTAIGPAGGWQQTGSQITALPAERVAAFNGLWPKLIYTLYRRFATRDPALAYVWKNERRIGIRDHGLEIGWLELDADGHLTKWAATAQENVIPGEEWIYGPHRSFGLVQMPAWGTRVDGTYRFSYLELTPSTERYPESMFIKP